MPKRIKLHPWSTRSSRYVLADRWIKVRADNCVTSDGVSITPYYVLEYPDWVHMVVLDKRNQVLITRQYRHGIRQINIELPCGMVDSRDKTPLAAAKRELLEETGYSGRFTLAGITSPNPATHTNRIYTYIITSPARIGSPAHDPYEVADCRFLPLSKILALIKKNNFMQALHISSLSLALMKRGIKMST